MQPSDRASETSIEALPTYVLITPARNEAQFIELTIRSVVSQTVKPLKWVIVSDGSTDGTETYLEGLHSKMQVRWFAQPNRGPAAARNLCI